MLKAEENPAALQKCNFEFASLEENQSNTPYTNTLTNTLTHLRQQKYN